jgi:hypothetical protein
VICRIPTRPALRAATLPGPRCGVPTGD